MTFVRWDYLPPNITVGEVNALTAANVHGWIPHPPVYNSLRHGNAPPPTHWQTAHLRYLERRGFIGERIHRADGLHCFRLNDAGMACADEWKRAARWGHRGGPVAVAA